MEPPRSRYWRSFPNTTPSRLRWRAMTVRHCFHVLPRERVLEFGAGSGLWTEHLSEVLSCNPITAAYFDPQHADSRTWSRVPNVSPIYVENLDTLEAESFDFIVGTAILCHDRYPETLRSIIRLLKPGGQILFFENNLLNPQVFLKTMLPATYWIQRDDVAAALKNPSYNKSGFTFSIPASQLSNGSHALTVRIINGARSGYFETPAFHIRIQ